MGGALIPKTFSGRTREEKQGVFVFLSRIREEELEKEEKYRAECYLQRCVPVTGTWHL